MRKKFFLVCILLFLLPGIILAQDGKVRGVVTDQETGDPLPGANVIIEGTQMGASTNLDGEFVIIAVPPGVYTISASFMGYQKLVISNVRVRSNLTTTQDFQLNPTALEVEALEVVAERPLVERNTTNTVRMTTQEDIENIPIRGLQNIIGLEAGVVQQNGQLHIRGGRDGEVAYFVDGVTATNPYNNTENIEVIQEATEEIQMQAGGYTAEVGGGNSGVVRTTLRTGGPNFKATLDYRTDDFVHSGEQFLGTSSYGYRNAVLTVSGPVPGVSNMRFFVAGQHHYMRNDNPMFIEPFRFEGLVEDQYGQRTIGDTLPNGGVLDFKRNHLPHNWKQDNKIQGTLVYDLTKDFKLRLTGSYQHHKRPTSADNFRDAIYSFFNLHRSPISEEQTTMTSLRLTHLLSPETYYNVNVYFSYRKQRTYDPVFGDEWRSYPDSAANFKEGYGKVLDPETEQYVSSFRSAFRGPYNHSTIYNFGFDAYDAPVTSYSKYNHNNIGVSGDFSTQLTNRWELTAGGRFDSWILRRFSIGYIPQLLQTELGVHGQTPQSFDSDYQREVLLRKAGNTTIYGYDIDGNKVDSGHYGPNKPVFASAYVQNKLEYRDLVLNLGMRYERVDLKVLKPKNVDDPLMDTENDWLDPDGVERTGAYDYFLPRLNFSFPVTDNTVFYALYGKFIQMPDLFRVYRGYQYLSQSVSPVSRSPYGYWSSYVGYTAKPEEVTQYEMGFRQSLTENFAFTVTGFYKNYDNQLRIDKVYSGPGGSIPEGEIVYCGYVNNDFSTIKGVELTLRLRRTQRLSARVNYTLSNALGTNSSPRSGEVAVSDDIAARYPLLMYPLDYNQPHRGSVMLDYRFTEGDGGQILEGMGLNLLLTFSSGHAYTKIQEPVNLGQANPWNIGVWPLTDPRNRLPEEPVNRSSTPWTYNLDMNLNKVFYFDNFNLDVYVHVLNVFNARNVLNVFPNTGTPDDDGWFRSPHAQSFLEIPRYPEFYQTVNIDNRMAYQWMTGNDVYGNPRQIRFGVKLELK